MILDNVAVRIALYFEVYFMRFLLALPPEISQTILPYSRGTIEKQLVGSYWLLSKPASQVPSEARKHLKPVGQFIIVIVFWVIGVCVLDILAIRQTVCNQYNMK